MYAHLRGILDARLADSFVLDVNGIGFRVFAPASTLAETGAIGETLKLYTHTYVREDTLALYGFPSREELHLFEQLLGVSGVGPKAALAVASALTPSRFALAVLTEDADALSKAQGVGKKTALRIILELKDRVKKEAGSGAAVLTASKEAAGSAAVPQEAVGALTMLGYASAEAQAAVRLVWQEGRTLEEVIREALKSLAAR